MLPSGGPLPGPCSQGSMTQSFSHQNRDEKVKHSVEGQSPGGWVLFGPRPSWERPWVSGLRWERGMDFTSLPHVFSPTLSFFSPGHFVQSARTGYSSQPPGLLDTRLPASPGSSTCWTSHLRGELQPFLVHWARSGRSWRSVLGSPVQSGRSDAITQEEVEGGLRLGL